MARPQAARSASGSVARVAGRQANFDAAGRDTGKAADDGPGKHVAVGRIGDQRARLLVYPSVWLLDAHSGLPLMQMPAGAGTFQTVPEQLEILRLEE